MTCAGQMVQESVSSAPKSVADSTTAKTFWPGLDANQTPRFGIHAMVSVLYNRARKNDYCMQTYCERNFPE